MSEYTVSPRLEGTQVVAVVERDGNPVATLTTPNDSAYNALHAIKAQLALLFEQAYAEGVKSATVLPPSTGGA